MVQSQADSGDSVSAILVLGVSNSGKSTFINQVLQGLSKAEYTTAAAVRKGLAAETKGVQQYPLPQIFGGTTRERVVIVDTPGFDHPDVTNSDVFRLIGDWLQESFKNGIKVRSVVYVHDISREWVPPAARLDWGVLERCCGDEAVQSGRVTIVLTKRDCVPREEATAHEEQMKAGLWADFLTRGGQLCHAEEFPMRLVHPAKAQAAPGLDPKGESSIQIQQELCVKGLELSRTAAGTYLGLSGSENRRRSGRAPGRGPTSSIRRFLGWIFCGMRRVAKEET